MSTATGGKSVGAYAYNLVFKRNVTYITYIVTGAVVLEVVYGKVTDGFWNSVNNGVRLAEMLGERLASPA